MKEMFGYDAYRAMCSTMSISVCNSNPVAAVDEITTQNLVFDSTDSVQIWQASSH